MAANLKALAATIAAELAPAFTDAATFLGPVGVSWAQSTLASVSLTSDRKVEDLAGILALADLAGRGDVLLTGAEALRQVPFTGDRTLYEPIRQIFCGAYRRTERDGADSSDWYSLISVMDNDGRPGPPVKKPVSSRVAGSVLDRSGRPSRSDALQATSGKHHVQNTCTAVLELYLMWAFGGSLRWSRSKIDGEIDVATDILRRLRALPG